MVRIHCYAEWKSDEAELVVGFMNEYNHPSDPSVFTTIEIESDFQNAMRTLTAHFKKGNLNMSLRNQDCEHWCYSIHGDVGLQFRKLRRVLLDFD